MHRGRPVNKQVTTELVMFVILQTLLTECSTFSACPVFHRDTSSEVHLHSSPLSLPDHALDVAFSITLNTLTLYQSTLWWFNALPCRTTLVGRFHHLINSCITIFSRSLLSAHARIVADCVRFSYQVKPKVGAGCKPWIYHRFGYYFCTLLAVCWLFILFVFNQLF